MDIRKIRLIDVINPIKWRAVIVSFFKRRRGVDLEFCRKAVNISNKMGESFGQIFARTKGQDLWYCELVTYRAMICSSCVNKGSCYHCGCTVPDNMLDKNNFCSATMWGPMNSQEEWEYYKKVYKIDFSHV